MAERVAKLPEVLTALIEERLGRQRQPLLDALGITATALSQYTRGVTQPSLGRLLALADFFDVSLDHLVYGTPYSAVAAPQPEVLRYVRDSVEQLQSRTAAHADLVARVGRLLADRIDEVTGAAVADVATEGLVTDQELQLLEGYATHVDVVTIDLDANVVAMADGRDTAAGAFLEIVAEGLRRGAEYRFVVSSAPRTADTSIVAFRDLLHERVGAEVVQQHCQLRRATVPTVLGMGLYRLDTERLRQHDPALLAQFSGTVDANGQFGYLIRPLPAASKDSVMHPRRRETARSWFSALWENGEVV